MQKLYHYTSVDSLEAILTNKTIRFNNLTLMDDIEEKASADFANAGRWVFTSSWTPLKDNKEMFHTYGQNGAGVCLALKNYPFFTNYGNYTANNKQFINTNTIFYPFKYTFGIEKYNKKYNFVFSPPEIEEFKIQYSDDPKLLYPDLFKREGTHLSYYDGDLGKVKNSIWSYQHEIRYRLRPTVVNLHSVHNAKEFNKMMLQTQENKKYGPAPIEHIDIPIDLCSAEITIGSNMTELDKKKIVNMIDELCSTAKIHISSIKW